MAEFTPARIDTVAKRLEAQALRLELTSALFGLILGAAPGVMAMAQSRSGGAAMIVLAVGALIGAAIGLSIGKSRAFMMRVEADKLRLLLLLEERTRALGLPAPHA